MAAFSGLGRIRTHCRKRAYLGTANCAISQTWSPHGFCLRMPDGNTVILKGILLLVAIAHLYAIRIVIFSTRRKPIEIVPPTNGWCYTVAFLRHQDSILSVGEWYPLELAKNWVKRAATICTSHTTVASPAIKRPEGAAPKRKMINRLVTTYDLLSDIM